MAHRLHAMLLHLGIFALAFGLYLRTAAPTLLSGDQAEHQMVAVTLGVPHATGYPLFTLLNALVVRVVPFGDPAYIVTAMTALWSGLAVLMTFVIARRLSNSVLAGMVGAATLATSAEWWSLATIAEVYALQALLILLVWYCLLRWWQEGERRALYIAACCAGLASSHHGSFVPIVVPSVLLLAGLPVLADAWRRRSPGIVLRCIGYGLLGLTPWLYLAAQFALLRPFDFYRGQGLPYHYYWGNPGSWREMANLALGGGFRGAVFTHGWSRLPELMLHFAHTLRGEVWWSGLLLGVFGSLVLCRRMPQAAAFGALVFVGAALFGINVAADIPKAHVYYLPAYVVWSVWAGVGAGWLAETLSRLLPLRQYVAHQQWRMQQSLLSLVLVLPLLLGWHRFTRLDRSGDDEPRRFAEAVLANVAPGSVILCRWELCLPLQYLQLAEGRRLDLQLDQTEPEAGSDWAVRAALYFPQHSVYAIEPPPQLAERYTLRQPLQTLDLWQVVEQRR